MRPTSRPLVTSAAEIPDAPRGCAWQAVACPDCGDASRHARRRCKARGGMCGGSGLILKAVPVPKAPVSADPEDRAMWWEENVTRLILAGRTDPLIDPAFLEEWDRTPPPLSSLRWADESGPAPDLARLAEWIPVSREVAE